MSFSGRASDNVSRLLANPAILDKVLVWREGDPRFAPRSWVRRTDMQRQFTMEVRVDYADNGKSEEMKKAFATAARHVFAVASLLADNVKPQIAIFSDDFFSGHEEISLLEDVISKGKDELAAAGVDSTEETISSELAAAVRS